MVINHLLNGMILQVDPNLHVKTHTLLSSRRPVQAGGKGAMKTPGSFRTAFSNW